MRRGSPPLIDRCSRAERVLGRTAATPLDESPGETTALAAGSPEAVTAAERRSSGGAAVTDEPVALLVLGA
jgi:hypothetical protein